MESSPTKVPMSLAVSNLAQLMEAIDGGEINDAINQLFAETKLDLRSAIDRRVCFFDIAKGQLDSLKKVAAEYTKAAKGLEYVIERVTEKTQKILEELPDYPYEGNLGRIQLQNSPQALHTDLELKSISVPNVVVGADVDKVDPKFIVERRILQLNVDALKEALKNGEEVPWASLRQRKHLRIYRK